MPRPIPLSAAPRRKPSGDFDEEEFFNSEPTLGEGPTRLAKVLVVVLFLALGVTLGIVIRWPRRTVAPPPPPAPLVLPAPKPVEPTPVTPTPPTEPGPAAALSDDAGEEPESDAAVAAAGDAAAVAIADSGVPATDASAALEPETPGVDVNALIAAGSTLYNKGQPAAAIKPLEQAAAAAPQSASIQILLSEARLDAGKLDAAEQAARRAVELAPEEPRAHLALGNVLQISGRNAQARGAYETYLKLAPKGEHANEVREILKSLR
jgi:Flp pilus assembly protein TadD